jgi:hypothetical protein
MNSILCAEIFSPKPTQKQTAKKSRFRSFKHSTQDRFTTRQKSTKFAYGVPLQSKNRQAETEVRSCLSDCEQKPKRHSPHISFSLPFFEKVIYSKHRENIYTPCNICPLVRVYPNTPLQDSRTKKLSDRSRRAKKENMKLLLLHKRCRGPANGVLAGAPHLEPTNRKNATRGHLRAFCAVSLALDVLTDHISGIIAQKRKPFVKLLCHSVVH